jgi:hypothetical protein
MTEHEKQELQSLPKRKLHYVIDVGSDRATQLAKELDDVLDRVNYARQLLQEKANETE